MISNLLFISLPDSQSPENRGKGNRVSTVCADTVESCRWRNSVQGIRSAHRHFLLGEMSPVLDLKRRPQPPRGRVAGFGWWGVLAFLWAYFAPPPICFLAFSKDIVFSQTALLQGVLSAASISLVFLSGSLKRRRGDPHGLLPDASSDKRNCLGRQMSGLHARCPVHRRGWSIMIVSRRTSLWSSPATSVESIRQRKEGNSYDLWKNYLKFQLFNSDKNSRTERKIRAINVWLAFLRL